MADAPARTQTTKSEPRSSIVVDMLLFAFIVGLAGIVIAQAREWTAPFRDRVEIDLSPFALPGYAFRSFGRGVASYAVSLIFTLVVGTVTARSRRAERLLLPVIDVLQGLPVLAFLPGLVLGMVSLFPDSNLGLELACILMIFTGQAWNMVFAYFGSLRSVSMELRDVARVHRFSAPQWFGRVELSSAMIPLVWNSMISMAGGWFFLMVNEAFTLGGRDFRLPGIGAYMSVAFDLGDMQAVTWAIVAMIAMIVATDQLIWRPLLAWSARFKLEEGDSGDVPRSWVLDLFDHSVFAGWLRKRREERMRRRPDPTTALATPLPRPLTPAPAETAGTSAFSGHLRTWLVRLVSAISVGVLAWGAFGMVELLSRVDLAGWLHVWASLGLTFLRILLAVVISAAWTLPAGIWIGRKPGLARVLSPLVQIVASFPAPMVFPLVTGLVLASGVNFSLGCTLLMVLGAQWYLLFNVIAGASAIPNDLDQIATAYGLKGWRRWTKLELPAIFPNLVTGLITAVGGAWNACIVTEYQRYQGRTLTAEGVGKLLNDATIGADFPKLAAGIAVISAVLIVLNRSVWKRLFRIAEERYSLQV